MQQFAVISCYICLFCLITYGYCFLSQRFRRSLFKIGHNFPRHCPHHFALPIANPTARHRSYSITDDDNQGKRQSVERCSVGNIVEYSSIRSGTIVLGYVDKIVHKYLIQIRNDANLTFTINSDKLRSIVKGNYTFNDFLSLSKQLKELKTASLEVAWGTYIAHSVSQIDERGICKQIYGVDDNMSMFLLSKTLQLYGKMYFKPKLDQDGVLVPLPSHVVQENIRDRVALQEFRQKMKELMVERGKRDANIEKGAVDSPDDSKLTVSPRLASVLSKYIEGLKQVVISSHNLAQFDSQFLDETELPKGQELLQLLGLAASAKNARGVLELLGIWTEHENIDKVVLGLQDYFPKEVIEEAYALLQNDEWVDPDERLRRDLTSLRTYAIDSEGTTEVDDALSIEYIDASVFHRIGNTQGPLDFVCGNSLEKSGCMVEKLWVHIADVSAFIPPGSKLAQEAEERMTSIYLPDEKMGMLPDTLTVGLLSLGAKPVSYALSLGVVLDDKGDVLSYEICPSKIRVTRRLSYAQLDDILKQCDEIRRDRREVELNVQHLIESPLFTLPEAFAMYDLTRLNYWALHRNKYRRRQGALDEYVKDITNLHLQVRKDSRYNANAARAATFSANVSKRLAVNGYMSWANTSSVSLVSEYMILMAQIVGTISAKNHIPVWYKTQVVSPPLQSNDLQIWPNETALLRSMRILRHLSGAKDSYNMSGPHATSGSTAYVQCTSPLRRYHDLYNHYQLKAAMHMFSARDALHNEVEEGLGYSEWKISMKTPQQKTEHMQAIRLVSGIEFLFCAWITVYHVNRCHYVWFQMQKSREQYWMNIYLEKVVSAKPRVVFDCVITTLHRSFQEYLNSTTETNGYVYLARVLQLGCQHKYMLFYDPKALGVSELPKPGEVVRCHMFTWNRARKHYMFIPVQLADRNMLPAAMFSNVHLQDALG